ncbi:DUF4126 family protein [Aureimonas fodinaquatilis]|uniref:DUF4126 family protein n=1 Tax=Aureimonas fodinaquatilis TaxID=2565783 RepID=A0A5B0DWT5_9HYPH|nr:DUF4126 family protein [Aureimonas fodinaquatilis]KAA0970462.1 DUF4126 family protein [Aureimonas fodinaquatilis]
MFLVPAFLIGFIAGLRAMLAPAALSWAVYLGWVPVAENWLGFFGSVWSVSIFSILAAAELVTDKLPTTPSRKVLPQFLTRIAMGALVGSGVGAIFDLTVYGAVAGALGAIAGTYCGAAGRSWLATSLGRSLPAALIEDMIAIGGAFLIVRALI